MTTGLRLPIDTLRRRFAKLKDSTRAEDFRPELARFATATLKDCIATTPVRSDALIARNQVVQYHHRVNYIPSFHTLNDPTLIHNEQEEDWIYYGGKWYNGAWDLPSDVYAAYQELWQERQRRLSTAQGEFVDERKQARFLYQRSWWQVMQSLGLSASVAAAISASRTRRKPAKEPSRGYGQWRGGKNVLTILIVNTFLDVKGKYWQGNGKAILAQATAKNKTRFFKECGDKVKREIATARRVT